MIEFCQRQTIYSREYEVGKDTRILDDERNAKRLIEYIVHTQDLIETVNTTN